MPTKTTTVNYYVEAGKRLAKCEPGEEIVISGAAGMFPECNNVYEFAEKLNNKIDLITDDDRRWKMDHPEIPNRTGKVYDIDKFDATFFSVYHKQAENMDPIGRILLEKAYETIIDAGYNPRELRGTRMGVFIGSCSSESDQELMYRETSVDGLGISGCSRAMLANRISYWLDVKGPSYAVDTACSSSLYALQQAYNAIRDGLCDSALVGGSNLCLNPYLSLQFFKMGVTSHEGKSKTFDESANGYTRGEAICMIFLQKSKHARRIYARLVHAKVSCDGFKEQGITHPSTTAQQELLEEFYQECEIPPSEVAYVEAHGTGTRVGDLEEAKAISTVMCQGRKGPLMVGSVKSNMGHSEGASGLCSVIKSIIAMELNAIPPNINFETPRSDIEALHNGQLVVVTEPTPWEGGYIGINNFGFGGANAHVLLQSNKKEKTANGAPDDDIPRLVLVSGRTEEATDSILNDVESRPLDVEYIRLLHQIHSEDISGHIHRGYSLVSKDKGMLTKNIQNFPGDLRPTWFIFDGMGSTWNTMGSSLMRIPIFADSIGKSHEVLKAKGIDLLDIITTTDQNIFDSTMNAFVGIIAIEVALVDVLNALQIFADGYIGHSVGELGCAYADGCLSAEQTVLTAYYRALALSETKVPPGAMASIGISYEELMKTLPSDVDVACHNGGQNYSISGPVNSVNSYVEQAQKNGIFARQINCSGVAYHSRYIAEASTRLQHYLKKIITEPKRRSDKWISTSISSDASLTEEVKLKYASADYFTNNLISPVLFDVACAVIPVNAVVVEISPHGLLQALLKRSLSKEVVHIPLTLRHTDNTQYLLTAVGKMYLAGLNPKIHNLYPNVEFPVSKGTPMLSPLIKWDHSKQWFVPSYGIPDRLKSGERVVTINLKENNNYKFLEGHVISGRNLFPACGYVLLAWETLAMMKGRLYTEFSVVLENIKFNRATNIPKDGSVTFTVMIHKCSGDFEIIESNTAVVSGHIHELEDSNNEAIDLPAWHDKIEHPDILPLVADDVYKICRIRGAGFQDDFRGIVRANNYGTKAYVKWINNYVTFMDNMLQAYFIQVDTKALFIPDSMRKLVIDVRKHSQVVQALLPDDPAIPVYVHTKHEVIHGGGIEVQGPVFVSIPKKKKPGEPVLEKYEFIPTTGNELNLQLEDVVRISVQFALENHLTLNIKTVELVDESTDTDCELISPLLIKIINNTISVSIDPTIYVKSDYQSVVKDIIDDSSIKVVENENMPTDQNQFLAIASKIIGKNGALNDLLKTLKPTGFILTRENRQRPLLEIDHENVEVCLDYTVHQERLLLLRKKILPATDPIVIKISSTDFSWIAEVKNAKSDAALKQRPLLLYSDREPFSGIIGFINCLRMEPYYEDTRCFFVADESAPSFALDNTLYKSQYEKNLAINVYKNGTWGSYRHLPIEQRMTVKAYQAYVNILLRGDLSSLKWIEGPLNPYTYKPKGNNALRLVYYAPLNFRDVMIATGKLAVEVVSSNRLEVDNSIGCEYAGRGPDGQRYMGILISSKLPMSSLLECDETKLEWKVPDHWTLEDAATVPVVYATAIHALIIIGNIRRGESVLIHAGTGGVGQAAINICSYYECEIFVTVGTAEKREFIRKNYPHIAESHIGNSRNTSFEKMIMTETNGRGVDIVLNSLAEEKLQASFRCLGRGGRFLEIGKYDLSRNNKLGMGQFLKETSFHGVLLDNMFYADQPTIRKLVDELYKAMDVGAVKPLPRTVFPYQDVEAAFRYMAAGKHVGKVLLKIRDEEKEPNQEPQPILLDALGRYSCSDEVEEKSYILCGGLGGFGLEFADWLVLRGARNIVLSSRSGIRTGYQSMYVRLWRSYGVNVIISTADITTEDGVRTLLLEAKALANVSAIFNLSGVLQDALFENQTEEKFAKSAAPKAVATYYLDKVSREMCPNLEQFVVFSSISCGRGNRGQTNYGMFNSVMERICEKRKADRLPALAIQWGAIGDVGMIVDTMAEKKQDAAVGGTLQQGISSCLELMDTFLKRDDAILSSMVIAEKDVFTQTATKRSIVDAVANILYLKDTKSVSLRSTLAELGMDSMMAMEIKQTLERDFEVFFTSQQIRNLTFAKLNEVHNTIKSQATQ